MEPIKYMFSCILTPITGLLNFGKNIRTAEETKPKEKQQEKKATCETPIALMCAVCTEVCSLAMIAQ